jgi:nucleoside-diphosphate-sugar epimerase
MRVLITGAAGFLGRHFAEHHIYLDHEVTAVDNMSSPYAHWGFGPGLLKVDAGDYLGRIAYPKYDIVYHFAAPVGGREKIEGDPLFNADSLRLDAALFRWAAIAKPKVVVYPSSSAVYGWMQQREPDIPLKEVFFNAGNIQWMAPDEMYGFTKLAGEFLAYKAAPYGVNTLCIRPFSGYGEDQSLEYPVPSIIARVKAREDPLIVWGPGTQTRDFIHVDDVVGATIARVKSGIDGYQSMNIGWGRQWSFNDLAWLAADIAGYKPEIVNLPEKPFGVMYRYSDSALMRTYYQPNITLEQGIARMLQATPGV